jgi:prepilin peptidase CpaA
VSDLKTDHIPNGFLLLGCILGLSCSFWTDRSLWLSLVSCFLAFLLLYPFFKIGAMGAGDIKLFIMIGTFCEVKEEMAILAGSFVIGAVFAVVKLLVEHNGSERLRCLLRYLSEVIRNGQWKLYGENLQQDKGSDSRNKIHFSVPILFSAALKMGGLF